MPLRDLRGYLWDVAQSCDHITAFLNGKTFEDYENDVLLRSAIERQFTVLGEALTQATKFFPDVESKVSFVRQIFGFRNRMIHEYAVVDNALVWSTAVRFLPRLRIEVQAYLEELGPA
jgi:uncharacterized protein with HEPN domain